MENKKNNWNELTYVKYTFWHDTIYKDKKQISIYAHLEIDYKNSDKPSIIINTEIVIDNNGDVRFMDEQVTRLNNLFRVENLSYFHLYLLPLEDKMIQIALRYAEKKIEQYFKAEGENL
jgi:hypothetical protein